MTDSTDSFTLFTNPVSGEATGYGWPRIAFDAFVARGFSVGGSLGIVHFAPDDGDSITGFLVAPRAGYAVRLGSHALDLAAARVHVYAVVDQPGRRGRGHHRQGLRAHRGGPVRDFAAPRVVLHLGPTFDLGVGGSTSVGGASVDSKVNVDNRRRSRQGRPDGKLAGVADTRTCP